MKRQIAVNDPDAVRALQDQARLERRRVLETVARFDAEAARQRFVAADFRWGFPGCVPSSAKIRELAIELLQSVLPPSEHSVSRCGGLRASRGPDGSLHIEVAL